MKKILIIEDDPFLSEMYAAKFAQNNFKTEVAADGKVVTAVEKLLQFVYHSNINAAIYIFEYLAGLGHLTGIDRNHLLDSIFIDLKCLIQRRIIKSAYHFWDR